MRKVWSTDAVFSNLKKNIGQIVAPQEEEENVPFELFDSSRYGTLSNLMFSDSVMKFQNIPLNEMSYTSYLGT